MTPIVRMGLITAGLVLILVATLPLAVVIRVGASLPSALTANEAGGTPWRGVLRGARWSGQPLGDVHLGLRPWPLLLGRARVRLSTPAWVALVERGTRHGFDAANGRLEYPLPFLPGAMASIEAREASLLFSNRQCVRTGGQIRAVVHFALPDVPELQLSGAPACDGAQGQLLLTTDQASALDVQMLWTIKHDGAYAVRTRVRSEDPAARLALQLAGFEATPDGLVRNHNGRFPASDLTPSL